MESFNLLTDRLLHGGPFQQALNCLPLKVRHRFRKPGVQKRRSANGTPEPPSMVVRPVGPAAQFETSRHAMGICRRVCNTSRYTVPWKALRGRSIEEVVESAVAAVVMQHDGLRVGVANEDKQRPYFSFVPSIDLRDMMTWRALPSDPNKYGCALLESLEQTHNAFWKKLSTRPGWEVIVHYPADLGFTKTTVLDVTFAFHHALADGVASKLFHRELLKALNSSSGPPLQLQNHTLYYSAPPSLLPGIEDIVPFKISLSYLGQTLWNEIVQPRIPVCLTSKPPAEAIPWTGDKISPEPHRVQLRLVEIPRQTLAVVLRACREHRTTLTPLIHVLIARSLARLLSSKTAPAFSTFTPIDLRRCANQAYDVHNKFASLVSCHEDVFDFDTLSAFRNEKGWDTEAHIWAVAAQHAARLRHKVSTLPNDDIIGMLSWVSDWKKYWTAKFGAKRRSTWEVSNIGSFHASDEKSANGKWKITRSMMTQGAMPTDTVFSVSVASVEGEGLCMSLSWQDSAVEPELMDALAKELKASLTAIADIRRRRRKRHDSVVGMWMQCT